MDGKSVEDSLPGGMHDWLLDRGIASRDFQVAGRLSEFEYQFRLVNGDEMYEAILKTSGPQTPVQPEITRAVALGVLLGIEHERAEREDALTNGREEKQMKWFYVITGTGGRSVKKSDAIYDTEAEAQSAGTAYLQNNKAAVARSSDPNEVFTVMSGRQ
jgi:hypothetical protein